MKKILRAQLLTFVFSLSTLLLPPTLTEAKIAVQPGPDFTEVAKIAIPAVVSIQVKSSPKKRQAEPQQEEDLFDNQDPFNFFNDEFFQHFFRQRRRRAAPQQQQPSMGQASGFFVSADGYIITNNHVVEGGSEYKVVLNDRREFDAELIGKDSNTDLAVLKIAIQDAPFLELGNSNELNIGQWVAAVGNPLGLEASLTAGVVSAKGRNDLRIATIEDFIQTDAAINRGNSGGPLLNLEGDVIGINTAIVTSGGTGGYMGIGFAIPSDMARYVMNELIDSGEVIRGFLGIVMQTIDQDLAAAFNLDKAEGALVAEVKPDSPAEVAGLKQGDIILRYNNKPITNIASLRNLVAMKKPGTEVVMTILRNGKTQKIKVKVGTYPDADQEKATAEDTRYGFEVKTLTPEIARNFALETEQGVVVTKVTPNSPASLVGLKKGALILSVNQKPVKTAEEFYREIKNTDENKPVLLLVRQGETTRYVSFKLG